MDSSTLPVLTGIEKSATGIPGLDEITRGGLPRGRPTLISGCAGAGKTLLAMEFVVRGAIDFGEPGVFMAFEETSDELTENVSSLGFDLKALCAAGMLSLDHVRIERSEIEETGEFDLQGLFVRLGYAIDHIGAKRVVLDSLEALFAGFPNEATLRAELRRLFSWLKQRGVTAVITAEQGRSGQLTRHGLEEYVSDCVIALDHRVVNQVATRRLRIVKYRGTAHGTNEYPTMIDERGLSVLPLGSAGLDTPSSTERVSTGILGLDAMFGGQGYFRGSSILVSGSAGTGKSSVGAAFLEAACRRGERSLLLAFEESPSQMIRNMQSIGMDLDHWVRRGTLHLHAARSSQYGLEEHLVMIHKLVHQHQPRCLVMDPITNLTMLGDRLEITAMLTRVIDFLKQHGVTAIFTSLTAGRFGRQRSEILVSSLMDAWIYLDQLDSGSSWSRSVTVLKSRGMAHSNKVNPFEITSEGIHIDPSSKLNRVHHEL